MLVQLFLQLDHSTVETENSDPTRTESTACALRTISIVHPRHKTRLLNNCEAMGCLGARKWARGQDFMIDISKKSEKSTRIWK